MFIKLRSLFMYTFRTAVVLKPDFSTQSVDPLIPLRQHSLGRHTALVPFCCRFSLYE